MVASLLTSLSNHRNQPWGNHDLSPYVVSLERRLHCSEQFEDYANVVNEYISSGHAERVRNNDLNKLSSDTFYLAHHAVYKDLATTLLCVVSMVQ
jgi:hypothetical protein